MASELSIKLLDVLDQLSGGVHPGFRPVHAKGLMYSGTFTPSADAAKLTRAPHAVSSSTPVTVRFSLSAGIPTVADNDPNGSSPQAMAVRFHLGDHVHTDIIAHSHNGFPTETGEEFLEFLRAVACERTGCAHVRRRSWRSWRPIPSAKAFVEAPKPIPSSFARQAYFAVTAFKFTSAAGQSRFGRFRLRPRSRDRVPDPRTSQGKNGRLPRRRDVGAAWPGGRWDFACWCKWPTTGTKSPTATAVWPETRQLVDFGTVALTERVDELAPERRKIIFDPVPRVDGIESAGDPLTEVRADLYLLSGRRRRADAAK